MCGLSAIVDFGPGERLLDVLLAMHEQIPFRGPDGEGFCVVDEGGRAMRAGDGPGLRSQASSSALRAGLAFRWLQIQDSSDAAAQPMASVDGSIQLLFNGEIYNFRELRDELKALGCSFRSESDTEVVLVAYSRWGREMFARLEGMWAIVLLDLRARKLLMSRDRFGIKPLYYHLGRSRLSIASEVKQLLAAGVPPVANLSAVTRFIRGSRPEVPEQTFFAAVAAQPAATYAEVDLREAAGELKFTSYWRLPPSADPVADGSSLTASCGTLDALLVRSVGEHMVGPVPMGILISGGLDSSVVAALATAPFALRGERGMGFSMVLDRRHSRFDETAHIDQVIAAFGFRGFTAELTPAWLKANIERVTRTQEEPVAGVAVAGQYLAFELAARHRAKVVLDGQGADELFAGYPRHQIVYLMDCARRLAFGDLIREIAGLLRRDHRFFREVWRAGFVGRLQRIFGRRYRQVDFIRDEPDAAARRATTRGRASARGSEQEGARASALGETLRRDVLTGNLRAVLALTDRNSMAHSIEARVPYVDRRIVEFAFRLPDRYKIGEGKRKLILRKLGARYLPGEIVTRVDRIGFGAPLHHWLVQEFDAELRALPDGPVFHNSISVDRTRLRRFIENFLSGRHQDAGTIWRLYAVDQWARAYAVTGI
jgi:asparagine synthase (glutamine-hydrolysing)